MWAYIKTDASLWTVGFYAPNGEWHTDSDHNDREEAAARCHYLNGGNDTRAEPAAPSMPAYKPEEPNPYAALWQD